MDVNNFELEQTTNIYVFNKRNATFVKKNKRNATVEGKEIYIQSTKKKGKGKGKTPKAH